MNAVRTAVTTLLVAAAAALSLLLAPAAGAAPAPAAVQSVAMRPATITSFQLVSGLPQWGPANRSRLARSVFAADASGRFVMRQPDGYPTLVGTMSGDGTFRASAHSSIGNTASTNVEIMGQVSTSAGTVRMNLTYVSGSTMAAVVNGQRFGANGAKAYRATMTMRAA